jgi:hypothetical protein
MSATASHSVYSQRKSKEIHTTLMLAFTITKRRIFIEQLNNSSVVRQMPGYNSQRWGTARTSQFTSQFFLIVMCAPSSVFCVLFVCKCVLYYYHRMLTHLQLNNNNNNNYYYYYYYYYYY